MIEQAEGLKPQETETWVKSVLKKNEFKKKVSVNHGVEYQGSIAEQEHADFLELLGSGFLEELGL